MTVKHNKTGLEYPMTEAAWKSLQASGKSGHYTIIQAAVKIPREIKLSGKQKPESDKVDERTIDAVPGGDVGENE